jgi:hypothetical protein
MKLMSGGFEATATCEPDSDGGTRIRIKARQKGEFSTKRKEEGFAKKVFEAIQKAIDSANPPK